jgi:peptidylprolyl isomerase domain and WD repeat-containing protein 1
MEDEQVAMPIEDEDEEEEEMVGPMPGPMPQQGDGSEGEEEGDEPKKKKKKRKRALPFEKTYLDALPSSQMYEKSYMHRDNVTHIVAQGSKSDFIITASRDGFLKFWKKVSSGGIEFVKVFRAHLTHITSMACSPDGRLLATVSADRSAKIFDVANFDMIAMVKLHSLPTGVCWMREMNEVCAQTRLAISFQTGKVHVLDHMAVTSTCSKPDASSFRGEAIFARHRNNLVTCMAYNTATDTMVSVDTKGMIEYWRCETNTNDDDANNNSTSGGVGFGFSSFPKDATLFRYKSDTHLFELAKAQCTALTLSMSPEGKHFAIMCSDFKVRVFDYYTGKLKRVYNETLEVSHKLQAREKEREREEGKRGGGETTFKLEDIDFGRRFAIEKKYQNALKELTATQVTATGGGGGMEGGEAAAAGDQHAIVSLPNAIFDSSGNFLIYSTLLGVKIINLHTNKVNCLLGKVENTERYTHISLYQGVGSMLKSKTSKLLKGGSASGGNQNGSLETDPTLFACAFDKNRFYMFSRREPEEVEDVSLGRDVFNEKPAIDEFLPEAEFGGGTNNSSLGGFKNTSVRGATIFTTMGDIHLDLFCDKCPKTCENFAMHSKNAYYNGTTFHRVIKGFMIQTGDPLGDGTGGESIWGGDFEDEIDESLRFDKPYILAMANSGPNTNGSQFFITCAACNWLDGKHTIFGRVAKGSSTVYDIERVQTDAQDKPFEPIKIVNIQTF